MIFNQKTKLGLLLSFHLAANGRTTIYEASTALNVSHHFLEQVANMLRRAGVVKSIRGPGGGYELEGNPTVNDVLSATAGDLYFVEESLDSEAAQSVNLLGILLRQCVVGPTGTTIRSFIADDNTTETVEAHDQRTV